MIVLLLSIAIVTGDSLVVQARIHPDSTRDQIARAYAVIASSADQSHRARQLLRARHLADAFAVAWNDKFLLKDVARFASWTLSQQKSRVIADSLKRAGNAALTRYGVPSAMKLWRESLRHASMLRDPSSIAPATLAIGAGFFRDAKLDSAAAYVERARAISFQNGDRLTLANATGILASIKREEGNASVAVELYRRAISMRSRIGDSRGIAADQNNIGSIAQERGDLDQAVRAFETALAINRREGRRGLVALNLSNLAGIASSRADFARADSLFKKALLEYRASGDRAEAAFTLHEIGKLQIRRGDYSKAAETLNEALRIHSASGAIADAAAVRGDLAQLLNASGDPEGALRMLRQAEAKAAAAPPDVRGQLAMARAELSIQFGTFDEAASALARAENLYLQAKDATGLGHARSEKAMLMHLRGDDARALSSLVEIKRSQDAAGDKRSAALTSLLIAEVQTSLGNSRGASQSLSSAMVNLRNQGDVVGEAASLNTMGDIALEKDSAATAAKYYRRGIARLGNRLASDVAWRLHAGLGEALRREGQRDAAASEFRAAIAILERSAAGVRLEERRSGFLSDKWSVYARLAFLEQSRGRTAAAFAVSERLRARRILDLLARGRMASRVVESGNEQDLRRRIAELSRELEVRGPDESGTREPALAYRSAEAIRRDLNSAQRNYSALMTRIREASPEYARIVSGAILEWRAVASRLATDEALIEYLLGDSTSIAFVVTHDTVAAVDLHVDRETLVNLVEFSRKTIERDRTGTNVGQWKIPSRRLYNFLVKPVEDAGLLTGKSTIVIAPHAELHFLPFGALLMPGAGYRFLIERYQIAYTPSATAWVQLGERRLQARRSTVLAYAPNQKRLPASRTEVDAISRIYGRNASTRYGASASEQALRSDLSRAGIIHLATFGVLNKHNPLFSFVELAPSGSDDGRLDVNEVFGLGLSGQLVVLSACQTGLGSGTTADVPPGDDWIGLVEAFLQAGAGSVVASLWPVNDRATAALMESFHTNLSRGLSPAAAVAEAQRAMLRQTRTASPYFWAGFVANGGYARRLPEATNRRLASN